ncbi:MAG TPA: calcium-binding protein, partial [Thermoleophilaceae bacterium]|nr:calcium-binding protein [Thermoleophilaceae bacterium]
GAPPDCCPGALGEDGSDLLEAGVGPGEVDYSPREAPVTVVLPSGDTTSSGNGEAGENDRLTRVRSVVGGLVGDVLVGGEGADSVTGGPGADTLVGGGGADVFVQDQLRFPTVLRPTGPDGADELHGGGGADTVDYGRRDARVTVVLPDEGATTTGNGGNLEGDQLTGIENVVTGDGDDIVTGSAEPNRIAVGLGVNSVAAGGGNDHLDAGAEAATDLLDGGDGADTVDYGTRANGVTVSLPEGAAESTGNGEPGEADRLRAVEHVIGGAGPDVLTGSSAPNSVDAGPGDDELWLEAGDTDELACGPGFDLAVLDAIDPPSLDCERTVLPPLAPLDLARPPSGDAGLGAGLSQPSVPSSRGIVTPLPAAAGDLRLARTQRHPRVRGRLQVNADAARVEVRLTARLPSRPARGRARRSVRRSVVGRSVQHVAGPVRLFFRATLTGRARAALSGRRSTPVRVRIVVTPTSGRSVSFSRTVVLKGAR